MTMLELREGFSAGQAVQALKDTAGDAHNAGSALARPTGEQLLTSYFTWADNAARALGNMLASDLVDDLVHTRNYWTFRSARGDEPNLFGLVLGELDQRKRAFTELAENLEREVRRWQTPSAVLIVPDTNVFLEEDKPFQDLNWCSFTAGGASDVRVVIPLVVIHELDRLKRTGNNTTRSMARQALKYLRSKLFAGAELRLGRLNDGQPAAYVEVYVHDGPSRPDDADGVIIRFTKQLERLSAKPTKLVTYDLSMQLRAVAAGVNAVQLPDE